MEQAFFVRVLFNNFSLRLSYNHLIQLQLASKTVKLGYQTITLEKKVLGEEVIFGLQ